MRLTDGSSQCIAWWRRCLRWSPWLDARWAGAGQRNLKIGNIWSICPERLTVSPDLFLDPTSALLECLLPVILFGTLGSDGPASKEWRFSPARPEETAAEASFPCSNYFSLFLCILHVCLMEDPLGSLILNFLAAIGAVVAK